MSTDYILAVQATKEAQMRKASGLSDEAWSTIERDVWAPLYDYIMRSARLGYTSVRYHFNAQNATCTERQLLCFIETGKGFCISSVLYEGAFIDVVIEWHSRTPKGS